MSKRILIFLIAFFGMLQVTEATHVAGGNITYVSLGPNQYRVRLTLLRDCSGTTLGTTATVGYRNTCGATGNIQVTLLPGSGAEIPTPCTDEPSRCLGGQRYGVQKYEYDGIVTLPNAAANCQTWYFTYNLCCRNNSNTLTGQPNFYVESMVNNSPGINNTSAYFRTFQVPAFCILEPVNVLLDADEPDGDSLVFALTPALIAANTNGPYQGGYSPTQPALTVGGAPVVNGNNGNVSFISQQAQNVVMVVTVSEYRGGILVGRVSFDVQLVLGTGRFCSNITPSYQVDTIARNCSGSLDVTVRLNTLVECNTVSANASELRLYDPNGVLIPIATSRADSCTAENRTRLIRLTLGRSMEMNGTYYLVSRMGTDGDTYGNQCQRYMTEFDTCVFVVTGCPQYDIPMKVVNVTVDSVNNNASTVQWLLPDSLNFNWFSAYFIWRRDNTNNPNYLRVQHTENDPGILSFTDYEPVTLPKDGRIYYKLNLGLTNLLRNPMSNELGTIRLENTPPDVEDNLTVNIQWSPYEGWGTPRYYVQYKDLQRDFPVGWQYPEGNASTTDTSIEFEKPILPGKYHARVFTIDSSGTYKSYSNWIEFNVKARDIKISNVITPNGDGVNDMFAIENLEYYVNGNLKIFNRWGQMVFENTDYKNDWSPADLEGGTYFYQLLIQKDTDVFEEYKGPVEVIR